uniref:Uncharacterized protein n=1 Tax=Nonomuraea gerenzanensis TaxID=93944 RepID=A0A1M4ENN8_9ACTN|nr:hypothetical protein BN4615_P9950 [Nonomuraea gerenzanensis]
MLAGMTGILVGLLSVADVRVDAVRRSADHGMFSSDCSALPYGEVHRRTQLKIHSSGVSVPLLISTTVATVAGHSTLAQPLLTGPRERSYQRLMSCLLRTGDPGWEWEEKRSSMPLVTVENGDVVVTDTIRIDSDSLTDTTSSAGERFGPWTFYRHEENEHWFFELKACGLMPWHDVTVEAPSGWLLNADPFPQSTDSRHTVWRHPVDMVEFTMLPDPETRVAAGVNQHPIRAVLVHFWDLVVLLLALVCTRTVELRRSAWPRPAGPDPAHDARAMRVRQASAVRARRRRWWRWRLRSRVFVVPCVLTALAGCATWVEETIDASTSSYWRGSTAVLLVASVLVLWAGHVLRRSTAVAMAAVVAAYAGIGLGEQAFPEELPSGGWTPVVCVAADLLLLVLLMSAVLNGTRLAWNPPSRPPDGAVPRTTRTVAPLWVWRTATAMAVLIVVYACYALARDRVWAGWLVGDLSLLKGVTWDLLWLPLQVLKWLGGGLVWIWPLAALAGWLRGQAAGARADRGGPLWHPVPGASRARARLSRHRRQVIVWVFAVPLFSWSESYAGLWLPVTVTVGALAFWFILRASRPRVISLWPLERPAEPDGPSLLATLGPERAGLAHDLARRFLDLRRRGRASDNQAQPAPDGLEKCFEEAVRWPPGSAARLPRGVTPLHLALLAGPAASGARAGGARAGGAGAGGASAQRLGLLTMFLGLIPMTYLWWRDIMIHGGPADLEWTAGLLYPSYLAWDLIFWFLPGHLLGLLWRELPGRTGPVKALSISGAYAVGAGAYLVLAALLDLGAVSETALRALLLFAVLTMAGLIVDIRTVRDVIPPWSRVGRTLLEIYRLESIPSQGTFLLAQLAAILAIIQFFRGQGGEPQYPSIDPFNIPRPPN